MYSVWQEISSGSSISGALSEARRGQTVQVRGVPEAIQSQDRLETPHVPTYRREAFHL